MELKPPDCSTYPLTPRRENDWKQCDRCGRLVCEVHDDRFEVRHSGENPRRGMAKFCGSCIDEAYRMGEIARGAEFEFINLR
jgi:hypothetical protein